MVHDAYTQGHREHLDSWNQVVDEAYHLRIPGGPERHPGVDLGPPGESCASVAWLR
jgi:hypothetical protein